MSLLLLGANQFNVKQDLFSNNEQGLWLDPSDMNAGKAAWRRNLFGYSEGTVSQFNPTSQVTTASTSITGFSNSIQFGDNSVQRYAYSQAATISGLSYTLSVYVQMDDDSIPSVGTSTGSGDFNVVFSNGVVSTPLATVSLVSGSLYRISVVKTGDGLSSRNFGVLKNTGQSSKTFRVTGYQLELGSLSEYQKITDFSTEFKAAFPTHTLYQDSNGVTPCTAAGDPVGLILDQSRGGLGALGSEIVTNGSFATDTVWSKGTGWSISGGVATITNPDVSNRYIQQDTGTGTTGKWYRVTIDVVSLGTGSIQIRLGSGASAPGILTASTTGTHTLIGLWTGTTSTIFINGTTTSGTYTIDNVSIKELPGNHAYQSSSSARPALARIPSSGRRNLLTRTEEFDNAAWTKTLTTVTANAAADHLGEVAADLVACNSTGASCRIGQAFTVSSGTSYTLSVYVKMVSAPCIYVRMEGYDTSPGGYFDIQNGVVGNLSAGLTSSISNLGNGWYRCSISGFSTTTDLIGNANIYISDAVNSLTVTSGASVYLTKAQLEQGSLSGYQKVVATTDVTESGVGDLWHLVFDGSDDSLVTNSVDFATWTQETRRNRLVDTESFGTSNWVKVNASATENSIAAPNAETTADTFTGSGAGSIARAIYQVVTSMALPVTFSVYAKKGTGNFIQLLTDDAANGFVNFNLDAGTLSATTATGAIENVGNGWYRCSIYITAGAAVTRPYVNLVTAINATRYETNTLDGTTAYLWGAQLESGSLTTYQRVGTDEMTVIAGVRKLSDAAAAYLMELSANYSTNAGAFALLAPISAADNLAFAHHGDGAARSAIASGYAAPITVVITGRSKISTPTVSTSVNGVLATETTTSSGAGNYGNYQLFIGRRNQASLPFTGHLYQLIIRGKTTPTGKLLEAEKFVSKKTGVNL